MRSMEAARVRKLLGQTASSETAKESQRRRAAGRNSANSPFSAVMRLSS